MTGALVEPHCQLLPSFPNDAQRLREEAEVHGYKVGMYRGVGVCFSFSFTFNFTFRFQTSNVRYQIRSDLCTPHDVQGQLVRLSHYVL